MARIAGIWCVVVSLVCVLSLARAQVHRVSCYDDRGRAQRCKPPFVNAAFNLPVEASNTCGLRGPAEYCLQTGITGVTQSCEFCDARDPRRSHPPRYLTDFHQEANLTWWQSETMLKDVQWPSSVNLTLHLGKSFDITYVRLKFYTSRPESFAIYKRTTEDSEWIPYQFYSASCHSTFDRQPREIITRADETKAVCTDEFSDISPLSGGSVAFSTLEGRPSAFDFEHSQVLQEWVTATDIMITLNRINTFGDEVFGDPNVLKSYFYAISDFAIGGKCKCNGHASECVRSTGQGLEERLVCRCEHKTAGPNCEECLPFYNDRPWGRAANMDAHECQPCNCNGMSNRCYFDEDLYARAGHGGHCLDCRDNTAGPNCERCKDNFYRTSDADRCQSCDCHPVGSQNTQCDSTGRCRCKPGVTGDKCDRCQPNHYEFGPAGCRECQCVVEGSRNNNPECLPDTGTCQCKENVEGQNCDTCKPGYYGMNVDDPLGCMSCFCYGHSSICESARGYTQRILESQFDGGPEKWMGQTRGGENVELEFNGITEKIGISAPSVDASYFMAPERYLGDMRFSYNHYLTFFLQVGEEGARASVQDVVLEGNGMKVSTPIYSQGNPVPRTLEQEYRFRLNEDPSYQWSPSLSSLQFQKILANLTALKIRGSYTSQGIGFLDRVSLESARQNYGTIDVTSVEECTCPDGYVGQFCESCAPGYHREPAMGGAYAKCVPCNCNNHSDACDVNTGRCICQHNTVGDNCEDCAPGYYGYAMGGTAEDCTPCPCPNQGECVELLDGDVACLNCQEGYTGNRCDMCADGYYGDPEGRYGPRSPCTKCTCNDNIDPNAVLNCNGTTGECLKCVYNTYGFNCDRCLPGFYGDPLVLPKGNCKACNCYKDGSLPSGRPDEIVECDAQTGQCDCQVRVIGQQCDQCQDGYWNINSGTGCERCNCERTGSHNTSCELHTGQCVCKDGVGGRRCDSCAQNHYGYSYTGCKACQCEPEGSYGLQCEERTGQCPCKDSVEGRQCDRCVENKFNLTAGCIDCPACYRLVQEHITILRVKINELRVIIENIGENPQAINDTDFRMKMKAVNASVVELWEDAKDAIGSDGSLAEQLEALRAAVGDIMTTCGQVTEDIVMASRGSNNAMVDIKDAVELIDAAEERLRNAQSYVEVEGQSALREAREAQKRFGQQSQRMTEIARLARVEAEKQESQAGMIESTAEEALNTSREALRIAQEAIRKPSDTAREIESINNELTKAQGLYEQTKQMSDNAKQQAQDSYRDSLGIYTEAVSLTLPEVDVADLNDASNLIKTEAGQIKDSARQVLEQHYDLLDDVEKQKQDAEEMLENGIRQQQIADELLADADAARDIARKALEKAEATLKDANETLRTLKEFDQKVQQSKQDAEEALKRIPQIEDHIREAEAKTQQARDDLADALADAEAAKEIAEMAQYVAEKASEDAGRIREDAETTKARASQLLDEALQLETDVSDVTRRLEEYEAQAEEDEMRTREALEKADQARESALDSSGKVTGALASVESILRQLNNLDTIDTDQLDKLEMNLDDAEQRLLAANIETRYTDLMESRQQQSIWVRDYTDELIQLRKDVENVREINETIPRRCFKEVELEPDDPSAG